MNQLSQLHPFRHYQTLSSHAAPSSTGYIVCHLLLRYTVLNTEPEPGNAEGFLSPLVSVLFT